MASASAVELPGYRRRIFVTPGSGSVRSALEDDYHHMQVTLHHQGGVVLAIDAEMFRVPWTTCPGAAARLKTTFEGVALQDVAQRGEKTANCTHLHDLTLLAAAHAGDARPLTYDVAVSDPQDDRRRVELRRDGVEVLGWTEAEGRIVEPQTLAGLPLDKLGRWIATLDPKAQEPARVLRWASIVALGRTMPMELQSDAQSMASGSCYTFQPDIAVSARRVGVIRDFSTGRETPFGAHPGHVASVMTTSAAPREFRQIQEPAI